MPRGDESGHGAALVGERTARQGAGRPIIIALVVLGLAVTAVLAIQIRLLLRGERPISRVDRDESVPTLAARDYERSPLTAKTPARPANAVAPEGSAVAESPDEAMPPAPLSMTMSPQEITKFLVNKELKALERSGQASATLTADALKAVDNMKRLSGLAGAEFSDFRCYGDGCAVTVTSRSPESTRQAISRSREFSSWPGATFMSGPLPLASGQVQAIVVLHNSREPSNNNTIAGGRR